MDENAWRQLLLQNGMNSFKNIQTFKEILINNRGYVIEKPSDELVLILFSGGMNSTVLIDRVIQTWNCKVILLYLKRGSDAQLWEEQAVDYLYEFYKMKFPQNILDCIKLDVPIPTPVNQEYLDRNRQKIFGSPLLNTTMWNYAFMQAVYLSGKYRTTIRSILIGSTLEDELNPELGSAAILASTINVCICMGLWYYQILAPWLDGSFGKPQTKAALLDYAYQYAIPLEKTRSCTENSEKPCGKCLACMNRNNAPLRVSEISRNLETTLLSDSKKE